MSDASPLRLPLALLVDQLAGAGSRGEAFLREFHGWLVEHAPCLELAPLRALGLVDVVLTFRRHRALTLVATGRRPDQVGEVTVHFEEADFPFIDVLVQPAALPQAYEICLMDYSVAERPVALCAPLRRAGLELPAGSRGVALVDTALGQQRHLRVRLAALPEHPVNLPPDQLRFLDEAAAPSTPRTGP